MSNPGNDQYLTTRELAELLRIKERKVYDMASQGEVPCVRVVGKLLFPRHEITRWIHAAHSGPQLDSVSSYPATLAGSHDPLLEWALRESQCGLASVCDGSRDGLIRMLEGQAMACGTHIHEGDDWNIATVQELLPEQAVVLVEFAQRDRGLILAPGKASSVSSLKHLKGLKVAHRQAAAASQQLFEALLDAQEVKLAQLDKVAQLARTESELGMLVFDSNADAAFGLASVARRLQLDFVPLLQERFDLLVWRKSWFDKPFQVLLQFMQSEAFANQAHAMGGYDISSLGTVRYNSPKG